jgi:DNA mismatch endonuclease (patch repair protein)
MASIRGKDTKPEMAVRRLLHAMGYRFRLHRRDLPGTPDVVLPRHGKAIFVHGCFWHGHGCGAGRLPKSRPEFWAPKIAANRERDARSLRALRSRGWSVAVVWACETGNLPRVQARLVKFLG